MSLAVVGLSHHTAPIEVRERFVYDLERARDCLLRLTDPGSGIAEAVLLSTCNRTELYCRLTDEPHASHSEDWEEYAYALAGALVMHRAESLGDSVTAAAAGRAAPGVPDRPDAGGTDALARQAGPEHDAGILMAGPGADSEAALRRPLHAVVAELAARSGMEPGAARRYLYTRRGRAAAEHLFRVAASLESLIVGEAQIQGQVREAYEWAASDGAAAAGPVLSRLFQTALAVGGRVRAATELGTGAASVPAAAIELARKIFGPVRGRRALVLGSGEMSELALDTLAAEGVAELAVASRSSERARLLAQKVGARALLLDDLAGLIPETDIIFAATAAPHAVITRDLLERAMPGGPRRPLLVVDIALPRDVEPAVGELDNVFLYDIDDLRQITASNLERRRGEIPAAERIVAQGVEEFWAWYASLQVVPVIRALRGHAEALRRAEVDKALRKLAHLSADDRAAVEALTRQILRKMLHTPTVRLREAASDGQGIAMMHAAKYLFELEDPSRDRDP